MYISKINLSKNMELNSENCRIFQSMYSLHKAIWGIFSDNADRKRDFLYRMDYLFGKPSVYAVSAREPRRDNKMWEIEVKQYSPQIAQGEQLTFVLRVNPVVSKRDEKKRQTRHDVIMDAKTKIKKSDLSSLNRKTLADLMQAEGSKWLTLRSESYGFKIKPSDIRVDGYEQHSFYKDNSSLPVCLSTLDITGKLTVTDTNLFISTLCNGIGPAKGFGCGLMLVKRT